MTISKLLGPDPLSQLEHGVSLDRIIERLQGILPEGIDKKEVLIARPYVEEPPLTYWDETTVKQVLGCLESDVFRSFEALDHRSDTLNRGLENLHRESPTKDLQNAYDHGHAHDLLILSNSFLPEYLRLTEHVLGNLLPLIWSVRKKGGINGKFVLKNVITFFSSKGPQALTCGYDDRVRNAIAHGEVQFTGQDIEFGTPNPKKFSSAKFLSLFDDLVRTCASLGLAIQLFWLKNRHGANKLQKPPLSLITLATNGAVTRDGLHFLGGIESLLPHAGRQLHIALEVDTKSKNQIIIESCRVARELLDQGAMGFDKFLFEIDSGCSLSSLVIILPKVLKCLIEDDAPKARFAEILPGPPLIWHDEARALTSLRAWSKVGKAGLKKAKRDIIKDWHRQGLFQSKGHYTVREILNSSVSGIARVEIHALLVHPDFAKNRDLVDAIMVDLARIGRHRLIRSRTGPPDKGVPWLKFPSHVFLKLFSIDGTSRWLKRGGWAGGNVVAVGEQAWGGREYVLVKKPQNELGKLRIRYEMDRREAESAIEALKNTIGKLQGPH